MWSSLFSLSFGVSSLLNGKTHPLFPHGVNCRSRSRRASQVALVIKNLPANAGDIRDEFDPWVGKIPWRRAWQPSLVFIPGESHGQRSLVGYSS